jgi:hypothetical protein
MSVEAILGAGAGILLVGFIVFAFCKGQSVKPSGKDPSQRNDYT